MNTLFFRTCLLAGLLACASAEHACAQSSTDQCIALRIADLTSAERDALSIALTEHGDARIAFACVPAGLIILESTDATRSADSLRLHAMPGLLRSVAPSRISEDHLTLQHAEELCANERDR